VFGQTRLVSTHLTAEVLSPLGIGLRRPHDTNFIVQKKLDF
jgi:hypothetical protein